MINELNSYESSPTSVLVTAGINQLILSVYFSFEYCDKLYKEGLVDLNYVLSKGGCVTIGLIKRPHHTIFSLLPPVI